MQTLILFIVFFGTVILLLGIYVFVDRRRLEAVATLRRRLGVGAVSDEQHILRDLRKSAVPFIDRLLTGKTITPIIERSIERAGVRWSVGEFVIASALLGAIGLLLREYVGIPISLLLAAIGLLLPSVVLTLLQRRRMRHFEAQLPDAIDMIVNAMRAGFSFQASMKFVGDEMPAPISGEFMHFYDEQRLGVDVRTALLNLEERVGTLDVKMLVTSLLIQRETGGNLAEILTGLATLIRDRSALSAQIDILTAEPKFTGTVLAVLPILAFIALVFLNPSMMTPMFQDRLGQTVLIYAGASVVIGYFLIRRIARIDI